eukprot:366018-Chlamydomonas_euryale.AAC.6
MQEHVPTWPRKAAGHHSPLLATPAASRGPRLVGSLCVPRPACRHRRQRRPRNHVCACVRAHALA